jgi:hypothetical protein
VLSATLVLLWLLAGCAALPLGHDLPFQTIERFEISQFYALHPLEPQHLFLITSAQQAAQLKGWVSQQAEQQLAQLDYGRYFVIAIFRGDFGSPGNDVVIQSVTRKDDHLVVHAQFWAPSPYYQLAAVATSPYHVIQVLRDGGPLEVAALQLEVQELTPTPPPDIRRLIATPPPK